MCLLRSNPKAHFITKYTTGYKGHLLYAASWGWSRGSHYKRNSEGIIFLTFTLSSDFIPQDVDLIDGPEILEHAPQLILIHAPGHLTNKHLDGIRIRLVRFWTCCWSRGCWRCRWSIFLSKKKKKGNLLFIALFFSTERHNYNDGGKKGTKNDDFLPLTFFSRRTIIIQRKPL